MPNGGAGHCGACLYNMRVQVAALYRVDAIGCPGYCALRNAVIPDPGSTYCANCEYDDFGDQMRREQLTRVVERTGCIKGSIWCGSPYEPSSWDREPGNAANWDYAEWDRWHAYVRREYPWVMKLRWLKGLLPDGRAPG